MRMVALAPLVGMSLAVAMCCPFNPTMAGPLLNDDPAGNEIRIGSVMPLTGPLVAFSSIGRTETAYFDMINGRGGINGRRVKLITYDDSSNPAKAVEQTRRLVESDKVSLIFGSFGTASNFAVRPYLNEKHIPHLFLASGDTAWNAPDAFPWTMGWQPQCEVKDESTLTICRHSIRNERLPFCGRTINWQRYAVGVAGKPRRRCHLIVSERLSKSQIRRSIIRLPCCILPVRTCCCLTDHPP